MKLKKKMKKLYKNLIGISHSPDVPSIFHDGSKADRLYSDIYLRKQKLLQKIGIDQDDADLEKIIDDMFSICRLVSYRMFLYGYFSRK